MALLMTGMGTLDLVEPVFREVVSLEDPLAEPMFDLFVGSFPPEEREPLEVLRAQIYARSHGAARQGATRHFVFEQPGEPAQLLGFVRGRLLPKTGAGFGIHLAVNPSNRSGGLGVRLLQGLMDELEHEAQEAGIVYRGLLMEVENPELARDEAERVMRLKRLRFFDKFGAVCLTPDYTQPPMAEHLPPVCLLMMAIRPSGDPDSLIQGFYAEAFGLGPEHEWVVKAVQSAQGVAGGTG